MTQNKNISLNKLSVKLLFLLFFVLNSFLMAAGDGVSIQARQAGSYVIVEGVNENPFNVTIAYNANFTNLKTDKKLPLLSVLKAFSKKEILKLHIEKGNFTFQSNYSWTMGSKDAKHNDNYIYRLPYKLGTKEMVSQGFNGKFSHYGTRQYAVDFSMQEGTGVYAAREGIVIQTKSDSNRGGVSRSFERDANQIIVEHDDATMATYSHLKQNGVVVKVGERVAKGQLIGYSGKTGYAQGPHLHFMVFQATDGRSRKSIPVKFMSARGLIKEPIQGQWYLAK